MNLQLKGAFRSIKKSHTGLLAAVCAGVILNVAAAAVFLSPIWSERMDTRAEVKGLVQMLETVGTQYTSEHVTDEQLNELLAQVPVLKSDSTTIVSFTDLAAQSRAPLAYATQQMDEEGDNSADGTNAENGLKTSVFEILIVGHMENLLTYMDNLHHYEQLFTIKKWTFTELKPSDIDNDYPDLFQQPFMNRNKPVLSLKLNLEAYSMPQFEKSLLKDEHETEGQASA